VLPAGLGTGFSSSHIDAIQMASILPGNDAAA
jgi:hypothetical protein